MPRMCTRAQSEEHGPCLLQIDGQYFPDPQGISAAYVKEVVQHRRAYLLCLQDFENGGTEVAWEPKTPWR
jgi:hypothetical protein